MQRAQAGCVELRFPFPCCPGPTRHGSPKNLEQTLVFQWCLKVFAFLVALMAFGVCVLRLVIDFSSHDGQVAAFRGVSEAFGSHFGAPKPSKTIENI